MATVLPSKRRVERDVTERGQGATSLAGSC